MNITSKTLITLAIMAAAGAAAIAQPTESVTAGQPAPELQIQQAAPKGVHYLNGGVGLEARDAMDAANSAFSLRNEFSGQGGQFVVPEKVSVSGPDGQVLALEQVGPILMLDLPPGRYTLEAQYAGQVQRKTVEVGEQMRTVSWNWAER